MASHCPLSLSTKQSEHTHMPVDEPEGPAYERVRNIGIDKSTAELRTSMGAETHCVVFVTTRKVIQYVTT